MKLGNSATQALLVMAAGHVMDAVEDINGGTVDEAVKMNVITHRGRVWEVEVRISPADITTPDAAPPVMARPRVFA